MNGSSNFDAFLNPPARYRPIPFWSWNDKLDREALIWQVREMAKTGVGGFFMHARGGLETPYLGTEWFEHVEACVDEAKLQGLEPWVYDEDGWPSGFAAGAVTKKGEAYHGRWLTIHRNAGPEAAANPGLVGLYFYDAASGKITRVTTSGQAADTAGQTGAAAGHTISAGPQAANAASGRESNATGAELVAVFQQSNAYYIDVLNPMVVRDFIDETHERYFERFPKKFGSGLRGFFTDEPRFSGSIDRDPPWSLILPEAFRKEYGYDLLDLLPALFLPSAGHERVRFDFWRLVSSLFVNSFMKQIGDWCRAHDSRVTGHIMMEESLFVQAANTAGVMPFYEHMDIPGVDWLRRPIGSPVVPKQVASVAAQLGKKQVITESYALCGWDVSFAELKRIAEWQFVNGVNLLCQHLEGFTLRGLRKRDYPPSLFYQQAWWSEYRHFNDYISRLGMMLAEGEHKVRVLVLHPMHSAWILFDGQVYTDEFRALDRDFTATLETLSGAHIEYHLGDETVLAGHGRARGRKLAVGACSYDAVVLPSMLSLDESTLELLAVLNLQGVPIISAGQYPGFVAARPDTRLSELKTRILHTTLKDLPPLLRKVAGPFVSISDQSGEIGAIHYTERKLGAKRVFFFVNLDETKSYNTRISIPGRGRLSLYRAEEGTELEILHAVDSGCTSTDVSFEAMRSCLLVFDESGAANGAEVVPKRHVIDIGPGTWDIEAVDANALTLDSCEYRIDNGEWQPPLPVIHLMDKLLGLQRSCDIELRFSFESALDSAPKGMFLALEKAEEFEIAINGRKVEYVESGWWRDVSFKKVNIGPFVRRGHNRIELRRRFYQSPKVYDVLFGKNVYETEKNKLTYDVELESIYVVGDFGVRALSPHTAGALKSTHTDGPFVIDALPRQVRTGDLGPQGFWFFSGSMRLGQDLLLPAPGSEAQKTVLRLRAPRAVVAKLFVNDREVSTLCWEPYEADISAFVKEGTNRVSVQLFSGNRNLLGPHHHVDGEPHNVGPDSFTGRWSWVEKKTEAYPATPEERSRNYWKDGYAFVSFGLEC